MIKSTEIRQVYEGPNLFDSRPLIRASITSTPKDSNFSASDREAILDAIHKKQPSHTRNWMSELPPITPLHAHFTPPELLAYLTVLFQRWIGYPSTIYLSLNPDSQTDEINLEQQEICFEYCHRKKAIWIYRVALSLVNSLWKNPRSISNILESNEKFNNFISYSLSTNPPGIWFIREAVKRSIPFRSLDDTDDFLIFGQGLNERRLYRHTSGTATIMSDSLSTNKHLAARVLRSHGLPVPEQKVVATPESALDAFHALGAPVCVKPLSKDMGIAVRPGIGDRKDVLEAFHEARKYGSVLVEAHIPGEQHRIMVINGRYTSVRKQIPAHVIGDGEHTVKELVVRENEKRTWAGSHMIPTDKESERLLSNQNQSWSSIPSVSERVYLRLQGNLATGGTVEDVEGTIHLDNILMAERAARVMDMEIVGIDFITTDISIPFYESGGRFCEINNNPAFYYGEQKLILADWYPSADSARIPVVAILDPATSSKLALSISEALAQLLKKPVSCTDKEAVYIDQTVICRETLTANQKLKMAISEPSVCAAVVSLDSQEIIARGIAIDHVDLLLVIGGEGMGTIEGGIQHRALAVATRISRQVYQSQSRGSDKILFDHFNQWLSDTLPSGNE
jgi:cyanophycin synthetase